jgi:hypothetical protein
MSAHREVPMSLDNVSHRQKGHGARRQGRRQPIGQSGFALTAAELGLTIRQDSSTA